jgi:hypothetical protein
MIGLCNAQPHSALQHTASRTSLAAIQAGCSNATDLPECTSCETAVSNGGEQLEDRHAVR